MADDSILGFLRRKAVLDTGTVYYEYLFLPIDEIGFKFNSSKIAPTLPANNASTLTGINEATGARGLNFQLDIGIQRMQFNVRTTLQPMVEANIPVLEPSGLLADIPPYAGGVGTARYLNYAYAATSTTGGDPGIHVLNAEDLRDQLLNFVADQSFIDSQGTVEYSEFCFGYPEWNVNSTSRPEMPGYDDTTLDTIAGTDYRIWYGMVDSLDGSQSAGVSNQYGVNFAFTVGVPVI